MPPTLVQTAQTATWLAPAGDPARTVTVSFSTGNLIVVRGFSEDNPNTMTAPTATGLTFTQRAVTNVSSKTKLYTWTAVAAAGGTSVVISSTAFATGGFYGLVATVWSGHGGLGAILTTPVQGNATAPSGTITTTGAGSAVDASIGDWNATAGAAGAWRTTSAAVGSGDIYQRDSVRATFYAATYPNMGAAGAKTIGVTTPTTQAWIMTAIEVLDGSAPAVGGAAVSASGSVSVASGRRRASRAAVSAGGAASVASGVRHAARAAVSTAGAVSAASGARRVSRAAVSSSGAVSAASGRRLSARAAASSTGAASSASGGTLTPYQVAVLSLSGLLGYWRLGESAGTVAADKLGARPGTYNGGVTLAAPGALVGDTDSSAGFDGATGTNVTVGGAALNPTAGITIVAWVAPGGGDGNARIIDKPNTTTAAPFSDWSLQSNSSGDKWAFEYAIGGTGHAVESVTSMAVGFSMIAATFDGTTAKLYVNGTLNNQTTSPGALMDRGMPVRFGAYGPDATIVRFAGLLDEVAIYGRALTAGETAALYSTGSGVVTESGSASSSAGAASGGSGRRRAARAAVSSSGAASSGSGSPAAVWVDISAATASTYLLTVTDEDADVRCVVTATNTAGSATAASNVLGPVTPAAAGTGTAMSSAGATSAASGRVTHRAAATSSSGARSVAAGALLSWVNISGATASSLLLTSGELGADVRCVVTASNAGGAASAASNEVGPVVVAPAAQGSAVSVAGARSVASGRRRAVASTDVAGMIPPFTEQAVGARSWSGARSAASGVAGGVIPNPGGVAASHTGSGSAASGRRRSVASAVSSSGARSTGSGRRVGRGACVSSTGAGGAAAGGNPAGPRRSGAAVSSTGAGSRAVWRRTSRVVAVSHTGARSAARGGVPVTTAPPRRATAGRYGGRGAGGTILGATAGRIR